VAVQENNVNQEKQKTALVTGVTGQDGSYLSEFLLSKGYRVVGLKRRTSTIRTERIDHIYGDPNFILEYFDLNDISCMWSLMLKYKPDEIYNLAAQSHVRVSFDKPIKTVDGVAMGTLRLLEAMRQIVPKARFYQASSSEMYGDNPNIPFNEDSKLMPASPYACAKVFAHNLCRNYRESYGLHVSSGILFNHESPRRGETFVTRKITLAAARIKLGLQKGISLGNIYSKRDWGYAGDYVKAMWLMMQQDEPDDYVIATNETHTAEEFLYHVFHHAGLGDPEFYVDIDPKFYRPHEVPLLLGDYSKAKEKLNWGPSITFKGLAEMMYDHDYKLILETIKKGD